MVCTASECGPKNEATCGAKTGLRCTTGARLESQILGQAGHALVATPKKPTLSAQVAGKSGDFLVEVYMRSIVTVKAKICVNGAQIGGDVL